MVRMHLESIAQEAIDLNLAKEGYTAFYVDGTNGLDTYPGDSWAQPFKTIQHAIDEAGSWAKIFVKAGTYAENVVVAKTGISIMGEKKETTIISPSAGTAIQLNADNGYVTCITAKSGTGSFPASIEVNGVDHCKIHDVFVDENGGTTPYGILVDRGAGASSMFTKISYVVASASGFEYAIRVAGSGKYTEIINCVIENGGANGISLSNTSTYGKIHDCEVSACDYNITVRSDSDHNTIFHNNLQAGVLHNIWDGSSGSDNEAIENFYDDHTTDTNNDGLCDTPYAFTGGVDYQPVSRRNGWKQESLGYDSATVNSLVFKGTVTTATSSTVFASTDLTGHGNDAFINDWYVYVFHDAGGAGAAPQGEYRSISDYVSSTGTFTHTAFSADLALTDEVFIVHSSMLPADGNVFARTGVVYFVGKGGNDANNAETWETRRLTVASGYGLCSSGDNLIIGPGAFVEDINFDTDGVFVFGRGQGPDGTEISGASTMPCRSNRFEDIFFYDNTGTVVKVGADTNANYNEFPNCRIGGSGSAIPLHIDASVAGGGSYNIFDKCNVYEGSQAAVLIDGGAAIGNIFRECRVRPQTGVASHGIHVNHASTLRNTFIDCVVVGAGSTGTGIYFQAGTHNIGDNCYVNDITTPYNIAANNYIVGCHEGSLIATNNTTEDDLKAIHDKHTGGEYIDTVSAGTAAKTLIKEITTSTRVEIKSIWLDLTLLVTAGATVELEHKIDGTNYRVFETDSWALTDDDGVLIKGFDINNDFKISITGGEAAGVDIYYNIIYQNME